MPDVEYSCKRKKDFVTFFAIAMFAAIVCFELYLILVLPIQLSRKNAMVNHVAKQRMLAAADEMHFKVYHTESENSLQKGEMIVVQGCSDILANYTRSNQENLTVQQVYTLNELIKKFYNIAFGWDNHYFHIREERFDVAPLLSGMEKSLDAANKRDHIGSGVSL